MTDEARYAPLPGWLVAEMLGARSAVQASFVRDVVDALERISPDLVPSAYRGPFASEVARGAEAFGDLVGVVERSVDPIERASALAALAEILRHTPATLEVVRAIESALSNAKTPEVATTAAFALAASRHAPFLDLQLSLLQGSSPSDQRIAARLLGVGRYRKAAPDLIRALDPKSASVLDAIIGALGELGEPRAVPALVAMLRQFAFVPEVLIALGRIADPSAVPDLIPFMLKGTATQRPLAASAVAAAVRRSPALFRHDGTLRKILQDTLRVETEAGVRFFLVLALIALDESFTAGQMLAALGGKISDRDASVLAGWAPRAR